MSENSVTPEENTPSTEEKTPSLTDPQEGLSKLVDASLPQGLHSTMQHVDAAMQQSHDAIQNSLQQSAKLIASASQHLQQTGLNEQANPPEPGTQNQGASGETGSAASPEQQGVQAAAHAESQVTSALEQQSQVIGNQMQAAMQQVQQSVHQASTQMLQANAAREQALTHLIQGQQQTAQTAPENNSEQTEAPAPSEPDPADLASGNMPPNAQAE